MPDNNAIAESWLVAELGSALAAVFETMTGARPSPETGSPGKLPSSEGVLLRQPFQGIAGEYWVFAPAASVSSSAKLVLEAAGMEDDDPETSKSTYLETVNQGLSGLAQSMSGKFEREITASSGSEQTSAPDLKWIPVTLAFPASSVTLYCARSEEHTSELQSH